MSEEATLDEFGDVDEDDSDVMDRRELIQGVAWSIIDSVPQEWEVNNVESDIEILAGNNFSSENFVDSGGIPLIRIRDLAEDDTTINFDGEYDSRYLVNQQDLLVGMDGEFEPHLWTGPEALLNQRVCKIEPKSKYNKIFFRYAIEKPLFYIQKSIAGTTVKHLSQSNINDLNLPTSPLPEQRKIATVLYTVDRAIEKTEEIIERTKKLEQGLMQDLFRRGVEQSETKELRRVGEVPQHWEIVSLGEVCSEITDGTHKSPPTIGDGYPYVTSQNIRDWGFDLDDLKYISEEDHERITSRCNPEPDDVLYVKDGANTGNVNVNTLDFEFSLLSSVALIKPDRNRLKPWFLKYLLSWSKFRQLVLSQMSGTGISRLTISKLEKTEILLPPIEEQERVVEILDTYYEHHKNQREYSDQLKSLKQGLMQDLLSGEVRTTNADIEVPEEIAKYG
jgi:type I restriction enzyme S subunit